MGLTLIFGVLGIADFAHGDKMGWGMFLAFFIVSSEGANLGFVGGRFGSLSFGWGLVVGLLVAMIGVALISVILERLVFRRLRVTGGGFFVFAIASLGMSIMLRAVIQLIWGPSNFRYNPGIHPAIEILGGIKVKPDQFFIVGVTVLAAVLLYWLLYRTRFGKAMRATSDNPALAEASGIDTDRIRTGTWIIAGVLGALAGVMLGLQAEVRFDAGFRLLLPLFAAVILGGIGNPWGALIGGLGVGIAQEVSTEWINTGLKPGIPFVIVIVVLLLRPRGLFGQVR